MNRFVILGVQRTGTTLIRTTLNSHSQVRCAGEVFKVRTLAETPYAGELGYSRYIEKTLSRKVRHRFSRKKVVNEYLDHLYGISGYEAIGFKLMQNQLKQFPMVVSYLKNNDVNVIHVIRENVLKTWVSGRAAIARGYHSTKLVGKIKIQIPTRNLISNLNRISEDSRHWADIFSGLPNYTSVSYEAFVKNKQQECERICSFLGLEYESMESSLVKMTPDNLSEVIENYKEVKDCLAGTPYEKFVSA